MATFNSGWYIDGMVIKSAAETSGNNMLATANHADSSYLSTGGHKWMIQVVNNTGSSVNLSSNTIELNVCVNYLDDSGALEDNDVQFVTLTSGTVAQGDSIYFGYNLLDVASSNMKTAAESGSELAFLADQKATDSVSGTDIYIYVMTRIQLRVNGTLRDGLFANPTIAAELKTPETGTSTQGIFYIYEDSLGVQQKPHLDVSTDISTHTGEDYTVWRRRAESTDATGGVDDGGGFVLDSPSGDVPLSANSQTNFGSANIGQWACVNGTKAEAQDHMTEDDTNGYPISAVSVGDPHITTLAGEHYEFDYLGAFRLYEATAGDQKLTINALAKLGPGRWSYKQYIRELYIQHGDKWAHVDMGFRGAPLKVLASEGLEHEEQDLPFDPQAKRYSFSSHYRTTNWMEPVTDDLPALVRNAIDFVIAHTKTGVPAASIHLENVNQFNLQPCRTTVYPGKKATDAKGCMVARRYATVAKLNDLRDTTPLREPTKEDIDSMPELEIAPSQRNIQWQ